MSIPSKGEISELLERIFQLKRSYCDFMMGPIGYPLPNSPATEEDIQRVEHDIGIKLPPSYRNFLSIHNGVRNWEGYFVLFSLNDYYYGKYWEGIKELKKHAFQEGNTLIIEGLPIAHNLDTGQTLLLDTTKANKEGEMEVVHYHWEEMNRYPTFFEYLKFCEYITQHNLRVAARRAK